MSSYAVSNVTALKSKLRSVLTNSSAYIQLVLPFVSKFVTEAFKKYPNRVTLLLIKCSKVS